MNLKSFFARPLNLAHGRLFRYMAGAGLIAMANSAALCTSFKVELMNGIHAFGTTVIRAATTKDSFKAALFLATASLDATTTAYSSSNEVSGTNYTAGGVAVTNANAPASSGTVAYWTPSASFAWTTVTLSTSFDCCLLYNSTQSNKAVGVYTFGAQTVTAGNFSLTMPTNDSSNALVRIA
jgi:hypothetical protein